MLNGRKRIMARPFGAAVSGLALAAVVGVVPSSTPPRPSPNIDDVKSRVDTLYHQAEQASERYNDAKLELKELRHDMASLKADQRRQDDRLGAVQEQVKDSIVRQYEGQSLSAVGQVVVSDDPKSFLSQLSTMSAFDDLQGQLFDGLLHRAQGAGHPARGDGEACGRGRGDAEEARRREGHDRRRSSPRRSPCSASSRPSSARH